MIWRGTDTGNYLLTVERSKNRKDQVKTAEKAAEAKKIGEAKAEIKIEKSRPHGKQSMNSLMAYGTKLTNIQISDSNIKSFDKVARKYGIDYSLKKDASVTPPRYMVFFKAKDVDVMTAAFKEYAGKSLVKTKKPSLRKALSVAQERVAKHRERTRTKVKIRGQDR